MTVDPFADETVITPGSNPPGVSSTAVTAPTGVLTTKDTMTDENGKIVVTLKGGKGYEAPWIVVHATDVNDAKTQVEAVASSGLAEATAKAAGAFILNVLPSGQPVAAATPASAPPTFTPQAQQPAGGGGFQRRQAKPNLSEAPIAPPQCAHGAMKWAHKVGKNGEYKGFYCASPYGTPRDQQCPKVEV